MRGLLAGASLSVLIAASGAMAQPGGGGPGPGPVPGCVNNCTINNLNVTGTFSVLGSMAVPGSLSVAGVINSVLGYQQNGVQIINTTNASVEPALFFGPFAGASMPAGAQFLGGFGPYAGESVSQTILELETVGHGAAIAMISAGGVAVGTSSCAAETTTSCFAVGADAMRDAWDNAGGQGFAVGNGAYGDGAASGDVMAIGNNTLWGAAATLTVAGAVPTAGDVWTFTFTTANACNGSTVTINCTTNNNVNPGTWPSIKTYTVQAADNTSAKLATAIATALTGANSINYILGDGIQEGTHNLFAFAWQLADPTNHPTVVKGHYPSSWQISTAASCVGTCGETIAVGPGFTGANDLLIGNKLFQSPLVGNAQWNHIISLAGPANFVTSASGNSGIGFAFAPGLNTGNFNTYDGANVLTALSSGSHISAFGAQLAPTCATGASVLLLGTGSTTDCATASESNAIHIGAGAADIFSATGTNVPATSVAKVAGTLNVITNYQANGTAGTSCATGVPAIATLVVTNGIITHC